MGTRLSIHCEQYVDTCAIHLYLTLLVVAKFSL